MKKTLFIIITFLVMMDNSFAQTYEPSQARFRYHGSNILLDQHSDFRQDNKFIITWHWYYGKKMSEALGGNTVHMPAEVANGSGGLRYLDPALDGIPDGANLIVYPRYFGWHWHGYPIAQSRSIHYDPALLMNTDPQEFTPRENDTTRPVLGFRNRRGYTPPDLGNPNYNRLVIENTPQNRNQVVLSEA